RLAVFETSRLSRWATHTAAVGDADGHRDHPHRTAVVLHRGARAVKVAARSFSIETTASAKRFLMRFFLPGLIDTSRRAAGSSAPRSRARRPPASTNAPTTRE